MDETNSLSEIEKLKTLLQSADLPANLHDKAAEQIQRIYLTLKHGGNISTGSLIFLGIKRPMTF